LSHLLFYICIIAVRMLRRSSEPTISFTEAALISLPFRYFASNALQTLFASRAVASPTSDF
jgi:hypothetical protein